MLDGAAYKALLSHGTDADLIPRLCNPPLIDAFAALANDLRMVLKASGQGTDRIEHVVRCGRA